MKETHLVFMACKTLFIQHPSKEHPIKFQKIVKCFKYNAYDHSYNRKHQEEEFFLFFRAVGGRGWETILLSSRREK